MKESVVVTVGLETVFDMSKSTSGPVIFVVAELVLLLKSGSIVSELTVAVLVLFPKVVGAKA